MNLHRDDRLRPPRAPAALERRVLAAARRALAEEANPTVWDRLWESRPLRISWIGATAALVLVHVLMGSGVPHPPTRQAAFGSEGIEHGLGDILRLPDMEISPRAESVLLGASANGDPSGPADRDGEGERS